MERNTIIIEWDIDETQMSKERQKEISAYKVVYSIFSLRKRRDGSSGNYEVILSATQMIFEIDAPANHQYEITGTILIGEIAGSRHF